MWHWYVSHGNELMLDIDRETAIPHMRRRLQAAINSKLLSVKLAYLFKSYSGGHTHAIIVLEDALPPIDRFVWEMILRSDIYRGCNNIMRSLNKISAAGLLITKKALPIYRGPDHICACDQKHSQSVMKKCPIANLLRGPFAAYSFFGKLSDDEFTDFQEII